MKELKKILTKKNWILPNWRFCSGNKDVCIEAESVLDIERRLSNLYFRFGWTGDSLHEGNIVGVAPYCLRIKKVDSNGFLTRGVLEPKHGKKLPFIEISYDKSPKDFDVSLYGHELDHKNYEQFQSYTPIGYYIISNPNFKLSSLSTGVDDLIRKHLKKNDLIFSNEIVKYNLLPIGNSSIDKNIGIRFNGRHVFSVFVPDYIPFCADLVKRINAIFSVKAECKDLNKVIIEYVLGKKKWDFIVSPLTPGAPYRNALVEQYFSQHSLEAWSPSVVGKETFRLIAAGKSLLTVRKGFICGINSNSMGLGDINIDDFIKCE